MTAVAEALAAAAQRLAATSDTPRLDAELLLAHALGTTRESLLLSSPDMVPAMYQSLVERRLAGEPIAYIIGRRAFWTVELEVGPGVLVPRPDSETLIAAAVAHFAGTAGPQRILDLGTGPGTLLLAALDQWPQATGVGVDISPEALRYAAANARRLGIDDRADFRRGDWASGVAERFDLLLVNPPYVAEDEELGRGVAEFEPAEALFAGPDGLDQYRRLAPAIGPLVAPGGLAAIEIGQLQADAVTELLERQGLEPRLARDLAGRPRALLI